ncbi:MAG: Hpt domain-containing protein [Hyphomicrobiaceae bacterium]
MSIASSPVREGPALIDQKIVDRYTQRGPQLITMLVDAFLEEAPRYFQDIRSGMDAKDYSAVRVSAHGLKSCSFNLGAVRLAEICQDLEDKASHGAAPDVESSVGLIGPTLFDTEEALKSLKLSVQASQP